MTRLLLLASRLFLAAIFLWAAATKLPDMAAFATDVANYRLLPAALVPWTASAVVGVEVALGLALLTGLWLRPAALVATALLVLFTVGIAQALLRGIDLNCGCFGSAEPATWLAVGRDLLMLIPAAALTWRGGGKRP